MKIQRWPDTGEWTTRRYLALLGNILIWVIVAIDAFYLWPTQLHGSTSMVIVSGHSMEPTYFTGDLVIARKMDPSVGDVIVYAPEGLGGSQIVHRIVGGNAVDGWVMQGDNNPRVDPFTPKGSEIRGVVLVHYANFGRVTVLLLNPIVWALVLLAAVVLLVWWSGDTCEDDPDDKDNDKREGGGDPEPDAEDEPDLIDRIVEGTEAAVSRMVASAADAGAAALAMLTRPSPAPRRAASVPRQSAPAYLRGSAVVAVLGLLAIYGPSTASASSLTINTGGNIFTATYLPCTTAPLTATPSGVATGSPATTYTGLTISGIPPSCNSRAITMYAYNSSGTLLISSTASTSTGTTGAVAFPATAGYDAAQIAKVYVFIDTWGIQATWTYTPPSSLPAATCVAVNRVGNVLKGHTCSVAVGSVSVLAYDPWPVIGSFGFGLTVTLSNNNDYFVVTFNLASTPTFPGWTPARVYSNGQPMSGTCTGATFVGQQNTSQGSGSSSSGYMYVYKAGAAGSPGGNTFLLCNQ